MAITFTFTQISFYVLSMLLDVVGNSLVIFIVAASRKMRTPTNVLLVNLAVADLLIGVLCMWVHLGDSVTQEWPFGLGICKVNMFAQGTYRHARACVCVCVCLCVCARALLRV